MFILDGFWSFLSFSYSIGFFPCKKTISDDGNSANLKKWHGILNVLKAILFVTSIHGIIILISYWSFLSEWYLTLEKIISILTSSLKAGATGLIFNFLLVIVALLSFLIIYVINWRNSQKLINLHHSMSSKLFSSKKESIRYKFGIFMAITITGHICQVFQISLVSSKIGITTFNNSIPFFTLFLTINMTLDFPNMIFMLTFLNVSRALRDYIMADFKR